MLKILKQVKDLTVMRSILMKCGSIDSQNLFTSKSQKKEKILNVTIIA